MIIICRISLFNKQGFDLIEEKYGIEKFLTRLQKECGGHGEGIALSNEGKVFFMKKGTNYKISTIVKNLRTMNWDWCVYHTRIASVGTVNDKNCHPFKHGDTILAMNGTESGYSGLAKALNITDTEAVLLSIKKFNLDLFDTLKPLGSNFIGFKNGAPFATSPNSYTKSYEIAKDDNGAIVIASSLPNEFTKYEPVDKPFVWKCNEELKVKEKKVYKSTVTTIYRTSRNYFEDWEKKISEDNEAKEEVIDYRRYECPSCEDTMIGYELIEDIGVRYCPICGEEISNQDLVYSRYLLDQ